MPVLEEPRRSFVEQVMGLPVSVLVRGPRARTAGTATAVAAVHEQLRQVDRVFSTYRGDSEVSRLRSGALEPADASRDVRAVLALCELARRRTDGWFDVHLPEGDGVRRLDPSGLVKGWAVQRASALLRELDGHDWLVNAGGDVVARAVSGRPWRVGVEDPRDRSRTVAVVPVTDGAVATSGSAARGAHVVDAHTGRPAVRLLSATVVGPSLCEADVQATAAFAQGPHSLVRLATVQGYEALLVQLDGCVVNSPGFPRGT